jgi:hypothetical protein
MACSIRVWQWHGHSIKTTNEIAAYNHNNYATNQVATNYTHQPRTTWISGRIKKQNSRAIRVFKHNSSRI